MIHNWIFCFISVTGLPIRLMLSPKDFWAIKLNVYIGITSRNLIIRPRSMAMVLTANEQRNTEPESNEIMLQSRSVLMSDEIPNELLVSRI